MILWLWRTLKLLLFASLVAAPAIRAQAAAPSPELRGILARLAAAAAELETALPNFECTETAISRRMRGDKQKQQVNFTATLRARRDPAGKLKETFQATTLEGRPFSAGNIKLPLYVSGGFANALEVFSTGKQICFDYSLAAGRIAFQSLPGNELRTGCEKILSVTGFATLDAAADVLRIERQMPADLAAKFGLAPQASLEVAPVELKGHTYRLSSRLVVELPQGRDLLHFEAVYTGCRLFGATVTLLPATSVITDDTPK